MKVWLLPYQFGCLLFLFVVLLWLGPPVLCWIKFVRVNIFVFFLILVGKLSFSPMSVRLPVGFSIFLNLLRRVLWPNMWCILEKVPCALEKNVYSVVLGWNFQNVSVRSIWSNVSFKATVSLLILFRRPNPLLFYYYPLFMFVISCFIYLGASMLGA